MDGKGAGSTPATDLLAGEASTELRMGRPLRTLAVSQATEALKTGAVPQTQVPVVQRALEQVLMAGSQARLAGEERIAAAGIGRTPQGTRILTDIDFMNALQAALVPSSVAQSVIDRGVGVSTAGLQAGTQGLGTAAGVQGGLEQSRTMATAQIIAGIMQALGQGAMGAGFAAGA